jgi:hypothetical protein
MISVSVGTANSGVPMKTTRIPVLPPRSGVRPAGHTDRLPASAGRVNRVFPAEQPTRPDAGKVR